ncbi:hypothetical protein EUA05_25790 [Mycobacterium paragordonae]|nr:hypothetical protein EUA05_25790 [Mycobacterium paragordonae]
MSTPRERDFFDQFASSGTDEPAPNSAPPQPNTAANLNASPSDPPPPRPRHSGVPMFTPGAAPVQNPAEDAQHRQSSGQHSTPSWKLPPAGAPAAQPSPESAPPPPGADAPELPGAQTGPRQSAQPSQRITEPLDGPARQPGPPMAGQRGTDPGRAHWSPPPAADPIGAPQPWSAPPQRDDVAVSAPPPPYVRHVHAASPGHSETLREQLRPSDLIKPPKPTPSRGWRKALYHLSFKTINPGPSEAEQDTARLQKEVGAHLRGTYTIAVLGGKGGAGKTVTTAAIGSTLKSLRSDPVVAIDADPAQAANLASRVDPKSSSVREINADDQLMRYTDVRSYTGQNAAGLDVVASPRHANPSAPALSPTEFASAHGVLQRFYNVLLVDCGMDLDHPVMPEVLGRADTIVMVASAVPDGAVGANTNFLWLQQAGYQQLLSRMVLVINHIRGSTNYRDAKSTSKLVDTLVEHFGRFVAPERIFVVPFDQHIAAADILDLDALQPETREQILKATAALAKGFAATTDPR